MEDPPPLGLNLTRVSPAGGNTHDFHQHQNVTETSQENGGGPLRSATTNDIGLTLLEVAAVVGNEEAVRLLFPVSQRIPDIPVWMPSGVLLYVKSAEAIEKRVRKSRVKAMALKLKGDEAFKRKDYACAEYWYTKVLETSYEHWLTGAIEASVCHDLEVSYLMGPDFTRRELYGYRCLCQLVVGYRNDASAFATGRRPEGCYLEVVIRRIMKDFLGAEFSFYEGLLLDPENMKLKCAWL